MFNADDTVKSTDQLNREAADEWCQLAGAVNGALLVALCWVPAGEAGKVVLYTGCSAVEDLALARALENAAAWARRQSGFAAN
jgi:hypothetical protein